MIAKMKTGALNLKRIVPVVNPVKPPIITNPVKPPFGGPIGWCGTKPRPLPFPLPKKPVIALPFPRPIGNPINPIIKNFAANLQNRA